MFLHAYAKTITFIEASILVILRIQCIIGVRHLLKPSCMFLHARAKIITFFFKTSILVILHFQLPISQPKSCFRASRCVFACPRKNHNFYRMSILIILCFGHPTDQPSAPFKASQYVFPCLGETNNLCRNEYFGNFTFWTPCRLTKSTFWGLTICFSMPI
jgi:hypothetical protein